MKNLNIRQVEVFKGVMEAGSVTAAARELRVTQPSVTKHLKHLEAELDVPLFVRTGNRLVPTPEGRSLYDQIERTYLGLDHLSRFADDLRNDRHGEILMAAMPLIAHSWLPEIVAGFLLKNADVSMSLPARSSRWISEWVAAGRVDFGIGLSSGDDNGVRRELLMKVPLVFTCPPSHKLAGHQAVGAAELDGESLISLSNFDQWRLTVETILTSQQVRPARRIDTFTTYTACDLVQRGLGVAIVDLITARKYAGETLLWRPFLPALNFEIFLMRPKHWQVPRLAERFIDLIVAEARKTECKNEELLSA